MLFSIKSSRFSWNSILFDSETLRARERCDHHLLHLLLQIKFIISSSLLKMLLLIDVLVYSVTNDDDAWDKVSREKWVMTANPLDMCSLQLHLRLRRITTLIVVVARNVHFMMSFWCLMTVHSFQDSRGF